MFKLPGLQGTARDHCEEEGDHDNHAFHLHGVLARSVIFAAANRHRRQMYGANFISLYEALTAAEPKIGAALCLSHYARCPWMRSTHSTL